MELKQALEQYEGLKDRIQAYDYALALANWDLATLAPPKGKAPAARAVGVLSGEAFQIQVSKEMREVLEVLRKNEKELSPVINREVELFNEDIEKLEKIPQELYQEYMELQSMSQMVWEDAKRNSDYETFAPYLEKIVDYTRQIAKLTKPDLHPYNACLDDYEKGLTMTELDTFFSAVRERTVPLVERIVKEGREIREDFVSRTYPKDKQEKVSYDLLKLMGYDLESGVLAPSEHPFTNTLNSGDVRLSTHYYENNLTSAILSTVHEAGHGMYEQYAKISPLIKGSTLDTGVAMSIHESQSRFFENVICRSRSFWQYYFPILAQVYPEQLGDVTAEEMFRAINVSRPGLIRIEADELTYNLHIMVRYELEKQLMEGEVDIKELPRLWNEKYEEYLGVTPPNNGLGVLQDVHWSGGMIGYFPSYALGNAYAAQIRKTMQKSLDLDALCAKGEIKPILSWLNENVYQYGKLKKPGQLIVDITGESLNPDYLMDYLEEKFGDIYF